MCVMPVIYAYTRRLFWGSGPPFTCGEEEDSGEARA